MCVKVDPLPRTVESHRAGVLEEVLECELIPVHFHWTESPVLIFTVAGEKKLSPMLTLVVVAENAADERIKEKAITAKRR